MPAIIPYGTDADLLILLEGDDPKACSLPQRRLRT